jgi:Protein of unknown function (DUF2637)
VTTDQTSQPGPGATSDPETPADIHVGAAAGQASPPAGSGWARWADVGLWAVACSGFALSYSSVQRAALAHVDHEALSYLLPVATDGGALAAAARYVADRRAGMAAARGWQLLAWAAIAASAALNAMGGTGRTPSGISSGRRPWPSSPSCTPTAPPSCTAANCTSRLRASPRGCG